MDATRPGVDAENHQPSMPGVPPTNPSVPLYNPLSRPLLPTLATPWGFLPNSCHFHHCEEEGEKGEKEAGKAVRGSADRREAGVVRGSCGSP
jgi:hypothetical protein